MKRMQIPGLVMAAFLLLINVVSSFAQTLKDVFSNSETPVLYLGIDFSKAKLIDAGNPSDIRDRLYGSINQVVITEPKKYDLKKALLKTNIESDLGPVSAHNATANLNEILSTNSADFNRFKESDIAAIVKGLNLSGKKGVGFLFVVEAMNKISKSESVWVTFIDMSTKKVLLTERMEGKAGGIAFRNYWVSPIKDIIDDIEKKKYKEWKLKYGS
jgi:hypothetical protein